MKNIIKNKYKINTAVDFSYSKKEFPQNVNTAVLFYSKNLMNYLRKLKFTEKRNIFFKENLNVIFCYIQAPGAPYTIIKCDELRKKNIKNFIILGMSAAIGEKYDFGDIFIVEKSLIGEGTSQNYIDENIDIVNSSIFLNKKLNDLMKKNLINFYKGFAWTTDCPLRETFEEINIIQKYGVNCIDMECSALFSFGEHFKDIECSAVFVTSDIFCNNIWNPGFSKKIVIEKIQYLADCIIKLDLMKF
ncbi:MAG: hypothetical protein M0R46_16280 [Candidatus Muirbacterium halophilum]|nr:hypothetical protein [Candidatus Muirbacterium halophilum]MCK9477475.1 hypothetical protein [Candidatus Muirbacterium halophilum]